MQMYWAPGSNEVCTLQRPRILFGPSIETRLTRNWSTLCSKFPYVPQRKQASTTNIIRYKASNEIPQVYDSVLLGYDATPLGVRLPTLRKNIVLHLEGSSSHYSSYLATGPSKMQAHGVTTRRPEPPAILQ